ncbi:hypothetical protein [Nocardia panacis]|uniref:hypothetical protein n=1 Tax=Nocardia panacis TaxID=2340916 RepID=UPI0011C37416|nr:hypothetical protein [Nocardia panacis]
MRSIFSKVTPSKFFSQKARGYEVDRVPASGGSVWSMDEDSPAERLRLAIAMFEFGLGMKRARLRRLHPDADESVLDAAVDEWLLVRPYEPLGKGRGRPTARFA